LYIIIYLLLILNVSCKSILKLYLILNIPAIYLYGKIICNLYLFQFIDDSDAENGITTHINQNDCKCS